jgi:hypothetical protein
MWPGGPPVNHAQMRATACYNSQFQRMKSLHGNTHGLKPNQLRRIEKLYQRRIPPHQIVTPEFARQLSELSHETNRQIGALVDRKGTLNTSSSAMRNESSYPISSACGWPAIGFAACAAFTRTCAVKN